MTPRFNSFLPFIFEHECVFAKGHWGDYRYVIAEEVEGDAGGITKWGCDYREFSKAPFNLTRDDIRNLDKDGATNLYWKNWNRFHVEDKPYPLGEVWFNCKVVSGAGEADLIASRTHGAAAFINDQKRVNSLIVERHPQDEQFLRGWNQRLADLADFLHISLS
jgi:lysozyme family protein